MQTAAVILEKPGMLQLADATLRTPGGGDLVVDVEWSGISAGTERLLWSGRMPSFPGMGYPLVPGYEAVGRVSHAGADAQVPAGSKVFVPGTNSFADVRSLFGASARRLVVEAHRCVVLAEDMREDGVLLALAATAHHIAPIGAPQPDLIVGHGVLGRLLARLAVLSGAQPVVWERDPLRRSGAKGYAVVAPEDDDRRNYQRICDVSGSSDLLDTLIARLAPGGEIVLAGFYDKPISFAFPPAFMREARIRVAAQWQPADLAAVAACAASRQLDLSGLISHRTACQDAPSAYRQAFEDSQCLKMCLDWRAMS